MPKLPFATERGFAGSCRIELAWLLYRCARTHSHSYEITPPHLRWHEHLRTARQSDLHALWRRLWNFGMGVLFEEMGAEQHSAIGAWLRKLAGRPGKDLGKNSFSQIRGLNRTESAGRIVIRRAHKTKFDSQRLGSVTRCRASSPFFRSLCAIYRLLPSKLLVSSLVRPLIC